MLTIEIMRHLWPQGDQHVPGLIEGIVKTSPAVFEKYGLTTSLEIAIWMAHASEECGAGLEMQENMNYTAQRLRVIFPSHFTISMAAHYAHNQQAIADIAYGGRMGNAPPPSTDGWDFRGQGLSQLTGKENYLKLKAITGLDVIEHPELLIEPSTALECGVADFVRLCNCLEPASKGDITTSTYRLNGGYNGLAERKRWFAKWKTALNL